MRKRLNRYRDRHNKRNQMIALCKEMYFMDRSRKSGFLGSTAAAWRDKVAAEYWQSSNKAQNVVDVMTAVLSGHVPQFHCLVPGNTESTIPSRAEVFLDGVFRLNSRRQQSDIVRDIIFNTVRDGGAAVRVYWMPNPPEVKTKLVPGQFEEGMEEEEELRPPENAIALDEALGGIAESEFAPKIGEAGRAPGMLEGLGGTPAPQPMGGPMGGPMPEAMPGELGGPMQPPLPEPGEDTIEVPNPDEPQAPPWVVQMHNHNTFPICLEVIEIEKLYPGPKGPYGRPYSEIFYVQNRTIGDVLDEWADKSEANFDKILEGVDPTEVDMIEEEYVEWWGRDAEGTIWYAIVFKDEWIVEPTATQYPDLPFVLTAFKKVGPTTGNGMERLPFLYPIFHAMDKLEYVRSRAFRQLDMFANMNPYHSGEEPLAPLDMTWGKIIELPPKEDIKFPPWPGNPPDIHREMAELEGEIGEGSFSEAMFGQVSSRASGYALSQVIGADTLRTDTPKGNIELALSSIADLIFGLMQVFSPGIHLAVTSQIRHRKMAAMLSGEETKLLMVETFVKPKQTNDEVRLATLGAQIAALPDAPVSVQYILEHYFGVNQPEDEVNRKLDEDAMKDPLVRLMALIDVLKENNSPYVPYMEMQLQQAMAQKMMMSQVQGGGGPGGVGAGLPQAVQGNAPMIPPGGNPSEENPTPESIMHGGPKEARRGR